ncbi:hypothetical protein HDU91_003663 [Kappamyces sp. JEL0680]|nr:hypothetical protein HDU91_003663 [Kappamyces sp. JEL0680]
MAYILTSFTYFGLEILQGGSLFFYIYYKLIDKTPRESHLLEDPPAAQYMTLYGFLILVFLLGSCYSLVAPLIVPFTAMAFTFAYVTIKYQLLYVYEPKIESGGSWWPKVSALLCFCLGWFQLTTVGSVLVVGAQSPSIFRSHEETIPCVLLAILPFLTLAFYLYLCHVMLPQSEFLDHRSFKFVSSHDEELALLPAAAPGNPNLTQRLFNPASYLPLPKIWVQPEKAEFAHALYSPMYESEVDFIRSVNPALADEIEERHKAQVASSMRFKAAKENSLAAFVFTRKAGRL